MQSCLTVNPVFVVPSEAYSHLQRHPKPNTRELMISTFFVHPCHRIMLAQRNLKGLSLLVSLVKIKKNSEQPPIAGSHHCRTSELSKKASAPLSTPTTCAWRTTSRREWKLRPFWTVCRGRSKHWCLTPRRCKPKTKSSNTRERRSLISYLYLPNKAISLLDT